MADEPEGRSNCRKVQLVPTSDWSAVGMGLSDTKLARKARSLLLNMVPVERFELPTYALRMRCSTN